MYPGINFGDAGIGREAPTSGAAQRRDREAFEELVYDYEPLVLRVALNVSGSHEAAQQIYCRVFKDAFVSRSQLNSGTSVFIWLYRILCRRCVEHCQNHLDVIEGDSPESDFRSRLRRAICSLTPTARVVFQLKQYEGLKIGTLAEIFDTTPEFVINNLQAANTHLRSLLRFDLNHAL